MITVLHLHVPRTGGISVARALTAAFGNREVLRTKKASDVMAALERGADVGLVSGHFRFGLHELVADPLYFIVLRDPVERVRSLYDYIRAVPVHRHHKRFASHSLETLLKQPPVRSYFANGQIRQIGALRPGTERMSAAVLERAWDNLCRHGPDRRWTRAARSARREEHPAASKGDEQCPAQRPR
jgi:hypothetical protein